MKTTEFELDAVNASNDQARRSPRLSRLDAH
jgi:hypothetical protein